MESGPERALRGEEKKKIKTLVLAFEYTQFVIAIIEHKSTYF